MGIMVTLSNTLTNFKGGSGKTIVHYCAGNVFAKGLYPANQRQTKVKDGKRLKHKAMIN